MNNNILNLNNNIDNLNNCVIYDIEISRNKIKSLNDNKIYFYDNFKNNHNNLIVRSFSLLVPFYCEIYIKTNIDHNNVELYSSGIYIVNNIVLRQSSNLKYSKNNQIRFKSTKFFDIVFLKNFQNVYNFKLYIVYKNINIYIGSDEFVKNKSNCHYIALNNYVFNIFFIKLTNIPDIDLKKVVLPIYVDDKSTQYNVIMKFYKITNQKYYMYIDSILDFKNIYDDNCECSECIVQKNKTIITKIFKICNHKLIKIYKEYMKLDMKKSISINIEDLPFKCFIFQNIFFDFNYINFINTNYKKNQSNSLINDTNLVDIYKNYS